MTKERSRFRTLLIAGTASILTLGAIGTIGAVQAQGKFGGPPIERMLDRALGSVDATDEQRTEIQMIVEAARADIKVMTADTEGYRDQFKALLSAEEIDRDALESLRETMLVTGDAVSARALAALVDAAELLSPEERTALLERGPGFGRGFGPRFGPRGN